MSRPSPSARPPAIFERDLLNYDAGAESSRRPSLLPLHRGGVGGRRARTAVHTDEEAAKRLHEMFGEPRRVPGVGCQMYVYDDPEGEGNGLTLARISSTDLQKGATSEGQAVTVLDWLATMKLRSRHLILTVENSGFRDYIQRPDLQAARQAIEAGWVKWIAWRDADRMARTRMRTSAI